MTLAIRILCCFVLVAAALPLGGCYVEATPGPAYVYGRPAPPPPAPPPPQGYYVYRRY
jgi:hypothetical protein